MEPPSTRITVVNDSGIRVSETLIHRASAAALERHRAARGDICVLLTSDEVVQNLNRIFRQVDEPTDVLTFPGDGFENSPLGDVAIAVPYATRQAEARSAAVDEELAFLAIHGVLHLCGFDDELPEDQELMVAEMNKVAVEAGLAPDFEWHSRLHDERSEA